MSYIGLGQGEAAAAQAGAQAISALATAFGPKQKSAAEVQAETQVKLAKLAAPLQLQATKSGVRTYAILGIAGIALVAGVVFLVMMRGGKKAGK